MDLIKPPELAARLGVPHATLAQWRYRSTGPAYLVVGRHIRYRHEDVLAWEEANRHEPASA